MLEDQSIETAPRSPEFHGYTAVAVYEGCSFVILVVYCFALPCVTDERVSPSTYHLVLILVRRPVPAVAGLDTRHQDRRDMAPSPGELELV
jgi:hypothetical protein